MDNLQNSYDNLNINSSFYEDVKKIIISARVEAVRSVNFHRV